MLLETPILRTTGRFRMMVAILLAALGTLAQADDSYLDQVVDRAKHGQCDEQDYDCRYTKSTLDRDSKDCKPAASSMLNRVLGPGSQIAQSPVEIKGSISYFGVVSKGYRYRASRAPDG